MPLRPRPHFWLFLIAKYECSCSNGRPTITPLSVAPGANSLNIYQVPYKKNHLVFPCGSRLHLLTHITGWMLVTPARNLMVYVAKHLSDTNTAIRSSFLQILNLDTHTKSRKPEPVLINLYDQQHKSWKTSIFRATSPKAMKTYCTQYVIMDTTRKLEARKANK